MNGEADVLGVPKVIYDVQKLLIIGNRRFDTLVAATHPEDIEEFKNDVKRRFQTTVNADVDQHLRVSIKKNNDGSFSLRIYSMNSWRRQRREGRVSASL